MPQQSWSRGSTLWALGILIALLAAGRLLELWISARHTRALKPLGAVEHGRSHFPIFVALHVAFPLALSAEVVYGGARPGVLAPVWFGLFVAAQLLRYSAIRALGEYWNVRVWVVPGMHPVRSGPYRFLRHPMYLSYVLADIGYNLQEWNSVTLLLVLIGWASLVYRIHAEERVLSQHAEWPVYVALTRYRLVPGIW